MAQPKRPPPIQTGRPRIDRDSVAFRDSFGALVVDLFLFRNHANPAAAEVAQAALNDPTINAARLHTVAFHWIQEQSEDVFDLPAQNAAAFAAWTEGFVAAGDLVVAEVLAVVLELQAGRASHGYQPADIAAPYNLLERLIANCRAFTAARDTMIAQARTNLVQPATVEAFVRAANNFVGNVYNLGVHAGVNIQVSDRLHLNFAPAGDNRQSLTPRSRVQASRVIEAITMGGRQITLPMTPGGSRIVGQNDFARPDLLTPRTENLVSQMTTERLSSVDTMRMAAFRARLAPAATAAITAGVAAAASQLVSGVASLASVLSSSSNLLSTSSSSLADLQMAARLKRKLGDTAQQNTLKSSQKSSQKSSKTSERSTSSTEGEVRGRSTDERMSDVDEDEAEAGEEEEALSSRGWGMGPQEGEESADESLGDALGPFEEPSSAASTNPFAEDAQPYADGGAAEGSPFDLLADNSPEPVGGAQSPDVNPFTGDSPAVDPFARPPPTGSGMGVGAQDGAGGAAEGDELADVVLM